MNYSRTSISTRRGVPPEGGYPGYRDIEVRETNIFIKTYNKGTPRRGVPPLTNVLMRCWYTQSKWASTTTISTMTININLYSRDGSGPFGLCMYLCSTRSVINNIRHYFLILRPGWLGAQVPQDIITLQLNRLWQYIQDHKLQES